MFYQLDQNNKEVIEEKVLNKEDLSMLILYRLLQILTDMVMMKIYKDYIELQLKLSDGIKLCIIV